MGSAIGLREDFDGAALRRLSRTTKSANQARRLLALAEIYDGGSRSAAARIGGVGLQIVRDWVIRFNARGPDGLLDGKAPGPRSRLNDTQRKALVDVVERGPVPAIHGVVRWRLIDLARWDCQDFRVWPGIMGNKESHYVTTQRTRYSQCASRPAFGRRRCQCRI